MVGIGDLLACVVRLYDCVTLAMDVVVGRKAPEVGKAGIVWQYGEIDGLSIQKTRRIKADR